MRRHILSFCTLIVPTILMSGCGGQEWKKPAAAPQPAAAAPQQAPSPAAAPAQAPLRTKAEVGVGAKGRGYGAGPVSTPIAAFFATKERLAFNIEIPHAMQLYKGLHDGQGPKTHEQFMQEIIAENHIQLPTLPAGHRYVYDPATEQLMVEKR